ncbi:thymidylate kinase [Novosphingobium fuchskuhlense]|uniref:Thymidylate kinase n=1 Tax=Novosphingobium fuchskuhlense TaxID=1117702 RepID=A0A117UV73_9SPHN|nr:dTMP kinase [Novosphingobium fuchskuhlense]KUR71457.1 thymidylate kinase [Novosphingobium fuchskuhlense]
MSGRFIVFEGGEGVGKSTQSRLLAEALRGRGVDVVTTREPGGTPGAEAIRALLLDRQGPGWGARAEALLFAAARADHVETLVRPALARGAWVVCDRYLDSSRAYQGGGSGLDDTDILTLHRIGSGGLLPDCTVLLTLDPAEAAARVAMRDAGILDRIGGRAADYHARVAAAFRRFAEAEPERFAAVDAAGAPDAVHARVLAAVDSLCAA